MMLPTNTRTVLAGAAVALSLLAAGASAQTTLRIGLREVLACAFCFSPATGDMTVGAVEDGETGAELIGAGSGSWPGGG